jgi:hypothetical protein
LQLLGHAFALDGVLGAPEVFNEEATRDHGSSMLRRKALAPS